MDDELTAFIIKELDRQHDRRKIIQKVCEKGGLHWKEAERLFVLVAARHKNTAVIPQTPVLLFWSIGMQIIQKVCEKGGLHWKEAERLFVLVAARHKNTAVIPQTPVLLFWSIGM